MASGRAMTVQEQAELALFLAKEGLAYQTGQTGHPFYATVRYAQSLSVFRSLNAPNETWVAFLLFHLGQLKTGRQTLAFFESAAYVQRRRREDKDDADMLWNIGQALLSLDAIAQSLFWLEQAQAVYQTLGLADYVQWSRGEIRKLQAQHPQAPVTALASPAHQFEIRVEGQCKEQFRVTPDGVVAWNTCSGFNRPVVFGLTGWEVVCVDG